MKDLIRWAAVIPLFIIPFLPLYSEGHLFFPFIAGKGFAFRILVEIALAAWVLLALVDKRYRPKWSWTLVIYGALVVWMFIADLFAANPHKAFWSNYERMDGFVTLIHAFLFFVIAGSVLTVGNLWKKWWHTALAASTLVAVHGMLQLGGFAVIHQGGVRLDANVGNAAYLAAYLLFIIAIAVWQSAEAKGWLRYALAALAAVHTWLLISTATRGALLGFVGAVILCALMLAFQSGKNGRRIGVGIIAGMVLLIGGFFAMRDTAFVSSDPVLSRIASVSLADGMTRFSLWNMAYQGALERPLTGWGHEGFTYIFTKHFDPALYAQEPWFDRAHNVFIDWLVYGGVPAFVLFIALLICGVVALARAKLPRFERIVFIGAIAAYAFQALFVFDNLLSYIFLAAILAAAHAGTARTITRLETLPEVPIRPLIRVALPIVAVIAAVTTYFVNVPGIQGGLSVIDAIGKRSDPSAVAREYQAALQSGSFATQEIREQLAGFATSIAANNALPIEFRQEVLLFTISEMRKEMTQAPGDSRIRIMLSQIYEAGGDYANAIAVMDEALALSPKKQSILVQKGILVWRAGDKAEAHKLFTEAYELAPSFAEAAVYAAVGKIITGDVEGGKALLVEHFGTTLLDRDALLFAYFEAKEFDEIIAIAKERVAATNGSAGARYALARAYASAGRLGEARAELQATIVAYPATKAEGEEYLRQLNAM